MVSTLFLPLAFIAALLPLIWPNANSRDSESVKNSGLDVRDRLIDSPSTPLEQGYLSYKLGWLAREGWESQPPTPVPAPTLGAEFQQNLLRRHCGRRSTSLQIDLYVTSFHALRALSRILIKQ